MIVQKEIELPKWYERKIKVTLPIFYDRDGGLMAENCIHFRLKKGALVCADGSESFRTMSSGGRMFRGQYSGEIFALQGNSLYRYGLGQSAYVGQFDGVNAVVEYLDGDGNCVALAVTDTQVYRLDAYSSQVIEESVGGVCAAMHYERLFTAKGNKLYYSAPIAAENWNVATQGAGWLELPLEIGDIVALVSFEEKLYLFCERGIMRLRFLGDTVNMKVTDVGVSYAGILPRSIAKCGRMIVYCTEDGFFSFNGEYSSRILASGFSCIRPENGVIGACYGGKYYAAVMDKIGIKRILCIDFDEGSGYFIRAEADDLVGGKDVTYHKGADLCRLTGSGFAHGENKKCVYVSEPTYLRLSAGRKYLRAVELHGSGSIQVTVTSDRGDSATVSGVCGELLRIPRTVMGNSFTFEISSSDEGVEIMDLSAIVAEERVYGY